MIDRLCGVVWGFALSMIIATLNIRGIRGRLKKLEVKKLLLNEKVNLICTPETKRELIDSKLCGFLWGMKILIGIFTRRRVFRWFADYVEEI